MTAPVGDLRVLRIIGTGWAARRAYMDTVAALGRAGGRVVSVHGDGGTVGVLVDLDDGEVAA